MIQVFPLTKHLQGVIQKNPGLRIKFKNSHPHLAKRTKYHNSKSFSELYRTRFKRQSDYPNPVIRIAVFLDESVYNKFFSAFGDSVKVQNIITTYMNNVQSIFNHPTLGVNIEIRMTNMYKISNRFDLTDDLNGPRTMVNPFCQYQESRNVRDVNNPKHWNVALLVTGNKIIDKRDTINIGEAVGRICESKACIVIRVGGMNLAHTIAHELGHM